MSIVSTVNNTNNPVPSDDYRDVQDNARVFDTMVNDTSGNMARDRLNVERHTLASAIALILANGATATSTITTNGNTAIGNFNLSGTNAINTFNTNSAAAIASLESNAVVAQVRAEADRAVAASANVDNSSANVDMEARRAINRERFAGSGWEHFGRHFSGNPNSEPINQGLYTDETDASSLFMGRTGSSSVSGSSKNALPTVHMAGFVTELKDLNENQATNRTRIKFDEAPTGAVTYDSATGTVFDYETQEDPKYSNIAADRNEAVARAFEGPSLRNGDLRFGDNGAWQFGSGVTINAGEMNINVSVTQSVFQSTATTSGSSYLVEFTVSNYTSGSIRGRVGNVRGLSQNAISSNGRYSEVIVSDGQSVLAVESFGGFNGTISNVSIRPVTNQVVTRRVDMWGFEGFLEEVTQSNPFVYRNGLPQSQATTMNGINTVVGTRPASYYAVFDGDTGSVGRGVNFFTATDAQKEAMLGDPRNNLYRLEDGRLVQFRVRQRTINGLGNGDWSNITPFNPSTSTGFLRFMSGVGGVEPQGIQDTVLVARPSAFSMYVSTGQAVNSSPEQGAFSVRMAVDGSSPTDYSVNGECYFLVGGTVSRLNQGAYHPELNSFGTKMLGDGVAAGNERLWSSAGALQPTTQADCFISHLAGGSMSIRGNAGAIGGTSGRTNDNRLFDAIYADGLGGVVDYRWSANDRSDPKWGAKAKLEVEAGTYRGLELLQRTFVSTSSESGFATGVVLNSAIPEMIDSGSKIWIETSTGVYEEREVTSINKSINAINFTPGATRVAGNHYVVTGNLDVSVSGNFTRTDTIADPVRLLATFPTGVEGGWVDQIPTGSAINFELSKTSLVSSGTQIVTTNDGASWVSAGFSIRSAQNDWQGSPTANDVRVFSYTAFAEQTERSTNAELLNAQNGQYGVNAVSYFGTTTGSLLAESLIGRVLVSDSTGRGLNQNHPYTLLNLTPSTGVIDATPGRESEHSPLQLLAPTNNGRGVKYAAHQVNDNGQATLNFIFNELDHDGTDWGDDSRLRVLNGTYTNQNGVSGLQANVDRLRIAYGLVKNEI